MWSQANYFHLCNGMHVCILETILIKTMIYRPIFKSRVPIVISGNYNSWWLSSVVCSIIPDPADASVVAISRLQAVKVRHTCHKRRRRGCSARAPPIIW